MLEDMATPSKEGLYLDGESVEAMVTNVEEVIRAYYDKVVEDIARLKTQQEQEWEGSEGEKEDEEDKEGDEFVDKPDDEHNKPHDDSLDST